MQKRNNRLAFGDSTLVLFLTDTHYPDIDPDYEKLTLAVAKAFQPSAIWWNGDICDFLQVGTYIVNPNRANDLQKDLDSCYSGMLKYRKAVPNARMDFKPGNHEARMAKYIISHADKVASLRSTKLQELLRLKELDCQFHPHEERSKIGHLYFLHGDEIATGSANPARIMLQRANDNVIFGHVHKLSVAHSSNLSHIDHICWSIGCGQYIPSATFDFAPQWCNAFALIEYSKSGFFHVNPIQIFRNNGKAFCIAYGRLFST